VLDLLHLGLVLLIRLADKQCGRPFGSLPSNTQPNPKGHNSKAYQPPQSRNEHVNAVFTRSGKSYNPPVNPNDQQNDFETPINFDSYDEDEESTPQLKTQNPKPVKETPLPKPYKPKILYPQRLRKEKMEAQYRKFLDMIRAVRINVPLIDKLKEVWSTICYEDKIFQDFLNTSESSNDKTNVVNAPQEPFVFNQDPGENSSQRPPHIDHHCCYRCGDSLDGIFCQRCTCESCGNGAHYGYNCPPKVPTISNPEPCHNQNVDEFPQTLPSSHPTCYSGDGSSFTYDSTPNFVDDSPNVFNPPPQPPTYSCEFCGNDAHYGYDCPPQVPFIYNPEPCYNQDFNFPQNFQCFQQQYICCTRCGGPHETFQCQPMNENYYEPNFCYNSNSFGFDQFQPSQFIIDHINSMNDNLKAQQVMNDSMSKLRETFQTWLQQRQEQVVNLDTYTPEPSQCRKIPIYYDDDDDEESSIPLRDIIISELPPCIAITPVLLTEEPVDSLIMEDKHLDTIPETESDELIKSSVEDLVHTPSESDGISESECDVPDCDDSQTINFSTFSNPLFDDSTSSDDESSHEEVIHEISFKTYSNPLFDLDEEIISSEFNPIHNEDLDSTPKNDRFDTESYLPESLLNRDTLMASSPKIDSPFDEFAGELITIPPRIVNREHEEYISLMERFLYNNSSPRPLEDFHAIPNTIIESLPTFPIPVEDSDSLREEIDIFPGPDDSIPSGIKSDDYDSEDDDNSTSFPEFE
ncbi:hypothetical protein Tco_0954064, partial [Tanacetum coccineum]